MNKRKVGKKKSYYCYNMYYPFIFKKRKRKVEKISWLVVVYCDLIPQQLDF